VDDHAARRAPRRRAPLAREQPARLPRVAALGADLVELDVHLAADGALPVIHDATLRRTTDRLGRVRTRTAGELRRARLRGPDRRLTTEHLPMLEDALAIIAAAGGGVLVEVKVPGRGLGVRYFPGSRIRPAPATRASRSG